MATADRKTTYSAAEVAALEHRISEQQAEIETLKKKLEHMNEVFLNAQRARFGQSSEKSKYVLGQDQLTLFNEAESEQDPKANPPRKHLQLLPTPGRKRNLWKKKLRSFP